MSTRQRILGCCIILILLLPTLFFPLGADHFTFLRGGELVMNGGKMYVDYYDQKPPLIYYVFGIGGQMFGYTELGMRIFDFLFQLIIIASLLYILKKRTGKDSVGFVVASFYSLSYTTMNASVTLQCESFAGLALIWLFYLQTGFHTGNSRSASAIHRPPSLDAKSMAILLLRGVCVGIAAGLKFPMGIVLLAICIDDILEIGYSPKLLLKYWFITSLGVLSMVAIALFPFYDSQVWHGYQRMWEYARFYAAMPAVNTAYFRFLLKGLSRFLGDNYSFFLLACVGAAVTSLYQSDALKFTKRNRLIVFSFLMAVFLLVSVVIERKLITYHFLRAYVPLSILAGYGLVLILTRIRSQWNSYLVFQRVVLLFAVGIFFVFSPLPRWINLSVVPYYYFYAPTKYDAFFVSEGENTAMRADIKDISSFIEKDSARGRTFAIATYASAVYYHLNERPFSKLTYSVWYFSSIEISGMRKEFLSELHSADWLVIEKDDHHPFLFGHSRSSWESLELDSEAITYVREHFQMKKEATFFNVMKRTTPD